MAEADWLGNLIVWFFYNIFAGIGVPFGFIFWFLGAPDWYYTWVTGLNMFPPAVTAYTMTLNA